MERSCSKSREQSKVEIAKWISGVQKFSAQAIQKWCGMRYLQKASVDELTDVERSKSLRVEVGSR